MRLNRFIGQGLHSFLSLDINFNKDLTFLVGINGSGKTTALDAIVALITPSLLSIGRLEFAKMRIDLEDDGRTLFVEAVKEQRVITIRVSGVQDVLSFNQYTLDSDTSPLRENETEREYYRDLSNRSLQHPVIAFIINLPTPMLLGLSRRSVFEDTRAITRQGESRFARTRRNIFAGSLSEGINEAISLVESQYRECDAAIRQLDEQLRQNMIMELLTVERQSERSLTAPSEKEIKQISEMRKGIDTLSNILGIEVGAVREKFGRFLDSLEALTKQIPKNFDMEKLRHGRAAENRDIIDALVNWSVNSPELKRIRVNQLGGREKVIDACRLDQQDTGRRKLYLIDGDFNAVLGRRRPRLKYLYQLKAYCVENILLSEDAVRYVGVACKPDWTERQVDKAFDYSTWIQKTASALKSVFISY